MLIVDKLPESKYFSLPDWKEYDFVTRSRILKPAAEKPLIELPEPALPIEELVKLKGDFFIPTEFFFDEDTKEVGYVVRPCKEHQVEQLEKEWYQKNVDILWTTAWPALKTQILSIFDPGGEARYEVAQKTRVWAIQDWEDQQILAKINAIVKAHSGYPFTCGSSTTPKPDGVT